MSEGANGAASTVTVATDVFSLVTDGRALVLLLARPAIVATPELLRECWNAVIDLADAGWTTSVSAMFGDPTTIEAYETGLSSDAQFVLALEAPSLELAHAGAAELGRRGFDRAFECRWLVGPREFSPVPSPRGRDRHAPWAFFALWEWNDAWQAATLAQRLEYDAECDVAFSADVGSGISIAGRHRLDGGGSWHHLGIWESPTFEHVTRAMADHERVADFKFTTSRHLLGRRRPLAEILGVTP